MEHKVSDGDMTDEKADAGFKLMFQLLNSTLLSVSLEGGNHAP